LALDAEGDEGFAAWIAVGRHSRSGRFFPDPQRFAGESDIAVFPFLGQQLQSLGDSIAIFLLPGMLSQFAFGFGKSLRCFREGVPFILSRRHASWARRAVPRLRGRK